MMIKDMTHFNEYNKGSILIGSEPPYPVGRCCYLVSKKTQRRLRVPRKIKLKKF